MFFVFTATPEPSSILPSIMRSSITLLIIFCAIGYGQTLNAPQGNIQFPTIRFYIISINESNKANKPTFNIIRIQKCFGSRPRDRNEIIQ